jgi:hypothetical protein
MRIFIIKKPDESAYSSGQKDDHEWLALLVMQLRDL